MRFVLFCCARALRHENLEAAANWREIVINALKLTAAIAVLPRWM